MLLIGCAKIEQLRERLNGRRIDDIAFEVVKTQGFSLTVRHSAGDDQSAKAAVKRLVAAMPELHGMYVNIQMVDEKGNLL